MRIFITGGHGFLGTSLVSRLRGHGHECHAPTSRECNLLNPQHLQRLPKGHFDRIFHLAAWTQAGDFCLRHPGEQWIINQKLNTHLLDWWLNDQPQARLIFMGTSCAYSPDSELSEPHYMTGEPIESLYTYAMTKRMLLQGARAISRQYGLKWLCAVPSTLYGPNYHTDGRQMHFIFDLVRKILRGKHYGEPVVLWGDGYQRRELVYVDDFIDALGTVTDRIEDDLINIGSGQDYQIREFADAICGAVGFDASSIQYDVTRYVGAQSKKLAIERLLSLYPDYERQQVPLAEGLRRVVAWFEREKAYGSPT
jgi:GDP-L-fucose synthase